MDNNELLNRNNINNQIEDEMAYYNSLSAPSKVRFLLEKDPLADEGFDEILNLAKEAEALSIEAGKADATEETKKQFAAASTDLHLKMLHFLYDLQVNQPERFNSNGLVANMIAAYNVNTNVAVSAIEDVQGDVFPDLCDRAFNNSVKEAKKLEQPPVEVSKERFNKQLADTVYLARLKEEYERTYRADKKAEILMELFSEKFIPNEKNYLNTSDFYKKLTNKFANAKNTANLNDIGVKKLMDEAAIEHAEDVYDEVYSYAEQGFGSEANREKAKLKIYNVEETKRVANNIGIKQGEDPSLKDFNNHPALDTIYIKKHIKLFEKEGGPQKNVAITLRQKQDEKLEYERQLAQAKENAERKFDTEFANMPETFKKLGGPYTHILAKAENDQVILNNTDIIARTETMDLPEKDKAQIRETAEEANRVALAEKAKHSDAIRNFGDEGVKAQRNYNNYMYALAHPEYKLQKRNEAIAAAENKFKEAHPGNRIAKVLNEGSVLQLVLVDERLRFENAKNANNTDEMKRIREERYKRDRDFKEKNIELYAPATYGGKKVYVTRERDDAANQIKISFDTYRRENNLENDLYIEDEYNEDVEQYNKAENYYRMEIHTDKRDRFYYEVQRFVQNNYDVEVGKIDLSKVEAVADISGIKPENLREGIEPKYTEDQLDKMGIVGAKNVEMAAILDAQLSNMVRNDSAFGTKEYISLKQDLAALANLLKKEDADPAEVTEKARILNSKLDLYIDRKLDEKENKRKESDTAKGRREAAQSARIVVRKILEEELKRANEIQKDHLFEEAAADLEAVMNVTGKTEDPALLAMMEKIKDKNYTTALSDMFSYLNENKPKVCDDEGEYIFRVHENEDGAKRRVPSKADGKIYKTVLLNFEKLENAYLKELARKEPWKVPHEVYKAEHLDENGRHSLRNFLKINIDTDRYKDLHPEIRPSEDVVNHTIQFEKRYLYYVNQASYTNESKKARWGTAHYQAEDAIPRKNQEEMVDAALSVYYLNAKGTDFIQNGQFNLEKAEEGRKKFISAVRKSGAYDEICKKLVNYFDLNNYDKEQVHQTNKQKRDAINTTEKFKTAIVSEVLSSVIAKKLGSAGELLAEEGKLKKDAVNKDMETVGYNLKVANILKLEDRVMGRAQELLNSPLKDVDFRRSYQKTADKFKERTVIKAEAVTHAIDFGKLMK